MQLVVPSLTYLDLKTTSSSLFLMVRCASVILWPAVIESIRIRTVPSVTNYRLILSVCEGHHKKTGARLVGNPCLKELRGSWLEL